MEQIFIRASLIVTLLLLNFRANSQDCGAILQGGIYDIHQTISSTDRASAFVNWFKQKQFTSYQEAKNFGLSIGLPIDGILNNFGLSLSESGFKQFQNLIESYESQETTFKEKLADYVQTINKDVVNAWTKCISRNGMHFWIEQTSDPKIFIVCAKYVDDGSHAYPELISFNFTPKESISPDDGVFFNSDGSIKEVTFDGGTMSQGFIRKNSGVVSVNINATSGDGLYTYLPEIRGLLPVISEFSATPSKIKIGQSSTLSWSVKGASSVYINNEIGSVSSQGEQKVYPSSDITYKITATNEEGENTESVSVTVDKMLDRKFYLKIYEKNDAGWFQPKINGVPIIQSGDVGYFPVPGDNFSAPWLTLLNIPQSKENNLINCDVIRWRDANGDPGARPYFFKIKFQIIALPNDNYPSDEIPITPIIEESATWYGDVYGLSLLINNSLTSKELYDINEKRIFEWKTAHGH